jgi:hypothetical protein
MNPLRFVALASSLFYPDANARPGGGFVGIGRDFSVTDFLEMRML